MAVADALLEAEWLEADGLDGFRLGDGVRRPDPAGSCAAVRCDHATDRAHARLGAGAAGWSGHAGRACRPRVPARGSAEEAGERAHDHDERGPDQDQQDRHPGRSARRTGCSRAFWRGRGASFC